MPSPSKSEAVDGLTSALRVMVDPVFLKSEKHQEQHWRANRQGADPRIIQFERALIRRMAKLGVPMWAHNMVRTPAEQMAVFVQGHSQKDGRGPYAHKAWAVDIVHGTKAWNLPDESWKLIGHLGKEVAASIGVKVVWGGDWTRPYDPAHWELADWKQHWS